MSSKKSIKLVAAGADTTTKDELTVHVSGVSSLTPDSEIYDSWTFLEENNNNNDGTSTNKATISRNDVFDLGSESDEAAEVEEAVEEQVKDEKRNEKVTTTSTSFLQVHDDLSDGISVISESDCSCDRFTPLPPSKDTLSTADLDAEINRQLTIERLSKFQQLQEQSQNQLVTKPNEIKYVWNPMRIFGISLIMLIGAAILGAHFYKQKLLKHKYAPCPSITQRIRILEKENSALKLQVDQMNAEPNFATDQRKVDKFPKIKGKKVWIGDGVHIGEPIILKKSSNRFDGPYDKDCYGAGVDEDNLFSQYDKLKCGKYLKAKPAGDSAKGVRNEGPYNVDCYEIVEDDLDETSYRKFKCNKDLNVAPSDAESLKKSERFLKHEPHAIDEDEESHERQQKLENNRQPQKHVNYQNFDAQSAGKFDKSTKLFKNEKPNFDDKSKNFDKSSKHFDRKNEEPNFKDKSDGKFDKSAKHFEHKKPNFDDKFDKSTKHFDRKNEVNKFDDKTEGKFDKSTKHFDRKNEDKKFDDKSEGKFVKSTKHSDRKTEFEDKSNKFDKSAKFSKEDKPTKYQQDDEKYQQKKDIKVEKYQPKADYKSKDFERSKNDSNGKKERFDEKDGRKYTKLSDERRTTDEVPKFDDKRQKIVKDNENWYLERAANRENYRGKH